LSPAGNGILQPKMFEGGIFPKEKHGVFEHISFTSGLFHLCDNKGAQAMSRAQSRRKFGLKVMSDPQSKR
jgi:hypothetical protein